MLTLAKEGHVYCPYCDKLIVVFVDYSNPTEDELDKLELHVEKCSVKKKKE